MFSPVRRIIFQDRSDKIIIISEYPDSIRLINPDTFKTWLSLSVELFSQFFFADLVTLPLVVIQKILMLRFAIYSIPVDVDREMPTAKKAQPISIYIQCIN